MTDKLYHECHEVIAQGKAVLEDLQHWGYEAVAELPVPELAETEESVSATEEPVAGPATLAALEASISGCQLCTLSGKRKNIVFGTGNPQARLVLIGEAPGQDEGGHGYPFVGEVGQLLDKILLAMQLSRQDVYLTNIIKCCADANRNPQADEIAACELHLKQQLKLIQPEVIIALGRFASQTLLKTDTSISDLRGQWREYEGIPVMPTFHPAYLLRNAAGKKPVWEDMQLVMQRLSQK